ncbi:MAG: hypothetical protein A2600_08270 [Candidatus Lambdaproteobacteria bacterium RIFOXYD1_FULL_56_27]|uniref:Uncharacterized protein n=1 Tax=Candidatus Lambdaproteobacteria bacterium RIFOXYD2_FULL_56_26 TaxID=1817773 RepID=A0A1F6H0A8_9PROT|nr:MAG: hypothetical protein A2426_06810 [Candidatus Lambdaproteobacteria bacterium RIFOXYC1_FULL_56_13]OGH03779.1 MAG: hypothetical protein A2557_13595 [Candidatus Lambdaproteobacteria bacterium RIFOXYD2_FULL_56_26]OGH08774.1 MAG: hypothetical protein A2600_08270 [Candidatus Lambdaproteobacteria bacterium RIFOXYD1_FULL_56_27]
MGSETVTAGLAFAPTGPDLPPSPSLPDALAQLAGQGQGAVHRYLCASGFACRSLNLKSTFLTWEALWVELKRLAGFELCFLLPRTTGLVWVLPSLAASRVSLEPLELVVLYLKESTPDPKHSPGTLLAALSDLLRLRTPLDLEHLKAEPVDWPQKGFGKAPAVLQNKSPKHLVEVTNELFHHGNLEALGKVLRDYEETYPLLKVRLSHQGQPVQDLYNLFQWGRVRMGDRISFWVEGPAFSDLSRLKAWMTKACSGNYSVMLKSGQRFFR